MSIKHLNLTLMILILCAFTQWVLGEGGLIHWYQTEQKIHSKAAIIQQAELRNKALAYDVFSLQSSPESLETYARQQLGLIKQNEVFFMIID